MKTRETFRTLPSGWRRNKRRKGAAVVEFAVVAPVLILLLLGMIECGRMIMVQQALTTAVREGARTAIVEGASASSAIDAAESFLAGAGITGGKITVTPSNTATAAHGQPITVAVVVPFAKVSWLPHPLFLGNAELSSTATMRRETPN